MTCLDRGSYVLGVCTGTDGSQAELVTQDTRSPLDCHAGPESAVARPTWWQKHEGPMEALLTKIADCHPPEQVFFLRYKHLF